ncbi:MAG: hypothetical protein HFJ55_03035 [Clostridia bacterium]|nr:hypothetical protein [Clostridia bacterium]
MESGMTVKYLKVKDPENPLNPKGENIAMQLRERIRKIEERTGFKLISACFLGEEHDDGEEDTLFVNAVCQPKVYKYMLFFR